MNGQPTADVVDRIKDVPIYRSSIERGHFPVLEKPEIARGFPGNWMTPALAAALEAGEAEYVLSTGTNHARMQIIRPPYFLLHSYYRLWSEHPDLAASWREGCRRVSLTTVLATEHVARVNARKRGGTAVAEPELDDRRLDGRTVYLNLRLDPAGWSRGEVERMLGEMREAAAAHPQGRYLLDCSSSHLAHLVRKTDRWDLWDRFPRPAAIVHAYEYTPRNVSRYLRERFHCPVVDLFGSTELGYLYYADSGGDYHPYLHGMSVELLPVAPGSHIHSLIVTSVRNPWMPLVRYRSGDCVRTADGSADPERITRFCGREKELLAGPHGPVAQGDLDDVVSDIAPQVFLQHLAVTEAGGAVLHCTTFDGLPPGPAETGALARAVRDLTGRPGRIAHHQHLPIGASGKYAWLAADGRPADGAR
ncbi:hypothetical protein GCM10020229_16830 [Kitasatospora albolonga]|uniref:hypothetical protein n=1 Tax=Kitasatospora albolonga TaxID=68173 RepID=UPI0031EFE3F2